MKATARLAKPSEGTDPTHDIGILSKLSEVHGAPNPPASDRNGIVAFLPERRKRIERIATQIEARRKSPAQQTPEISQAAVLILETQTKDRVVAADDDGPSLEERASRLASELSPSAFRIYDALVKARKWPFTIALNGEACGGCNMRLPSGLIGEIRRMTTLHRCPFCKRVLAETAVPS